MSVRRLILAPPHVGPQLVKRYSGKLGHSASMTNGNAVPLSNGAAKDPEISREPGKQAPLVLHHLAQQRNALIHAPTLSTAKRLSQALCSRRLRGNAVMLDAMEISLVIKRARAKAALSQRELAAKLRVSPSAVAQWELATTMPSVAKRVELSRLLHIPFNELVPEGEIVGTEAIKDPVIAAIVQQLAKFPEPLRQSVLIQVTALAQAVLGQDTTGS